MKWKTIGKKLLFLPPWLMILLIVVCAVLLTAVFVQGESPIAYFVYVLSFYTLCTVVIFCIYTLPPRYRQIRQKIYDNPYGNRYMTEPEYRTKISLFFSLGINVLYIGFNLLSWAFTGSWWFAGLSVYYLTLSLMRFLLLGYARRDEMGDSSRNAWRRCKICAWILLFINLSLSGTVFMIVYYDRGYSYEGFLIYVMAAYTFYITIHAITEIIKYRRFDSPLMSTAKIISLCAALVSMLNLETAMFSQFGAEMAPADRRLMIILTGAGVSISVVALSVLLMVRASRELKQTVLKPSQ